MSEAQTNTDCYKVDHRSQYPRGTELVFANWTARKSRLQGVDKVVFFGLQAHIQKCLVEQWANDFFDWDREDVIANYKDDMESANLGISYEHIGALHDLGYLPIEIWALPEGTAVPIGVPMFVMWNTKPEFFWLTNYLETSLSANIWHPCTSATIAKEYRKILESYTRLSGGDMSFVDIQGHDFSYRGMSGDDSAARSGAGHLLSFKGTDTIPAIKFLEQHYHAERGESGGSIFATEHSVMCMGTKGGEIDTIRRLITEIYPSGVVSIVVDTWDYWKVLTEIAPALKNEIMARDGKVVFRPDSGDPADIICGDPRAPFKSPARRGSFDILWDLFGGTINKRGYKQLDPHIGLIYGDSITLERANDICMRLTQQRFVPSVVLGIGSYTYQYVTRDTFGFALKSTAGVVNGEIREIFKDPVTDDGTKKSAKGFVTVDDDLKLVQVPSLDGVRGGAFDPVFCDGVAFSPQSLPEIRDVVRRG